MASRTLDDTTAVVFSVDAHVLSLPLSDAPAPATLACDVTMFTSDRAVVRRRATTQWGLAASTDAALVQQSPTTVNMPLGDIVQLDVSLYLPDSAEWGTNVTVSATIPTTLSPHTVSVLVDGEPVPSTGLAAVRGRPTTVNDPWLTPISVRAEPVPNQSSSGSRSFSIVLTVIPAGFPAAAVQTTLPVTIRFPQVQVSNVALLSGPVRPFAATVLQLTIENSPPSAAAVLGVPFLVTIASDGTAGSFDVVFDDVIAVSSSNPACAVAVPIAVVDSPLATSLHGYVPCTLDVGDTLFATVSFQVNSTIIGDAAFVIHAYMRSFTASSTGYPTGLALIQAVSLPTIAPTVEWELVPFGPLPLSNLSVGEPVTLQVEVTYVRVDVCALPHSLCCSASPS